MDINNMDAAEKEVYKEAAFRREKRERLETVWGKTWRLTIGLGIAVLIASVPFGAIRGVV